MIEITKVSTGEVTRINNDKKLKKYGENILSDFFGDTYKFGIK